VAEVCEMGRCVCTAGGRLAGCTRVCVCVWHRGGAECSGQVLPGQRQVSATAGARGALPPTRAAPGWQLGGPKLHSFHSGPVEVQQLVECRWTNRAVRSLSISDWDWFLLTAAKGGAPSWAALGTLPCDATHCSCCLLFLSVLQLQLLHHLHKAAHCGGLERDRARVAMGQHFPREISVMSDRRQP